MKVSQLKRKADDAWARRSYYDAMLRDVYDYVLPMRSVTGLASSAGGRNEGASRVDKVFDATAVKAAFRFAGRLQTELTPIFQEFFALEAGPLMKLLGEDEAKQLTENLQKVGNLVNGVLASGQFHNSAHEAYVDLYAGTCHLLVDPGDDTDLVRFRVVPVPEVAIEEGPFGQVEHWYWKREWPADQLKALWPKGKFSETLQRLMSAERPINVEICQYTYLERDENQNPKGYKLVVWCKQCSDDDAPIWEEEFRTSPWITARFFKVPGEPYGRGPAQLAMPFIKTANKTRELQLKGAAFALMGLWMYKNDGGFNPDTVKFEPRAMWAVTSTGGNMGPSIARLPVPGPDFDTSQIVMADEREQMKMALFDDALPPEAAAVRSATEVAERVSRLSQDFTGVAGRLTLEFIVNLVRRVIDILEQKGKLQTVVKIDQLLTQVRVVAPIAVGQAAAKVQGVAQWGDFVTMLGGPEEFKKVARTEKLFPQIGRWLGVAEEYIRSPAERKQLDDKADAAMQATQQAELAQAMPEGPSPAEQLLNGGMM